MQQVSITEKRAGAVDFSEGYFDVNQALIANEGSPAIGATTLAELKGLNLGAPIGTTSLDVIEQLVQPTDAPTVYDDLDLALKDLKNGQVDGVVVDFPTAFYGYADVVVGQFSDLGEQEQFGLTFEKGNTFVECVNLGIEALRDAGTLRRVEGRMARDRHDVPTFSCHGRDGDARAVRRGPGVPEIEPDPDAPLGRSPLAHPGWRRRARHVGGCREHPDLLLGRRDRRRELARVVS